MTVLLKGEFSLLQRTNWATSLTESNVLSRRALVNPRIDKLCSILIHGYNGHELMALVAMLHSKPRSIDEKCEHR